jgi:diaminohydroxyphosphoribosylaminopyrimidine deaminase / 5-amino-6-(5-phosphoribosylamino)uracil reductase
MDKGQWRTHCPLFFTPKMSLPPPEKNNAPSLLPAIDIGAISGMPAPLLRCLELARMPGAAVAPNPRVGAVVMWHDRIIGEGAHMAYGGPHAEVNAIRSVQDKTLLRDATLYVSLEPCNHHGKTPPCTELILEMGIPRVVIGSVDPNPQMSGKSIAFLRSRGVQVEVLDDQRAFVELNRHFWVNQTLKRPYVVLKWAESADGLISGTDAAGEPQPRAISCPEVNRHFHWLRHELQAIWIGNRTAAIDNPSLTTRLWPGRDPLRIVMDRSLKLHADLHVFQGPPTLVINAERDETVGNVRYWKVAHSDDLSAVIAAMYQDMQIGSVLVEGGRHLLQQFLDAGLWDEIYRCVSPQKFERGVAAPRLTAALAPQDAQTVGIDRLEWYAQSAAK